MIKYLCPHCGREISQKKEDVSNGYFGACMYCDEDFYKTECVEVHEQEAANVSQQINDKMRELINDARDEYKFKD